MIGMVEKMRIVEPTLSIWGLTTTTRLIKVDNDRYYLSPSLINNKIDLITVPTAYLIFAKPRDYDPIVLATSTSPSSPVPKTLSAIGGGFAARG